ncbi:reverse transcriptase domain-containing protein [Tanacetum coccineum]
MGIRSFLVMPGIYGRFIQDFSKSPAYNPPPEKELVYLLRNAFEAFETLKLKLTQAPILVAPDRDLPFKIMCDASDFTVGAVLGQHMWGSSDTGGVCTARKLSTSIEACTIGYHRGDIMGANLTAKKVFDGPEGTKYYCGVDYLSKWVEAKATPQQWTPELFANFNLSSPRFGAPRAIISDRRTHFCNDQFAKVMLKYRVTHRLSTAYHPQTSGQVEVSNRGLKRILERTIGENCDSWSDKLDDALWAFRTAYITPIGCTPYKIVYEKACHLPIELEHKAYWALKHANFNLVTAGDHERSFYGRFSFYDPSVDKIKEVIQETDIQEKDDKASKNGQNRARNGKDKVKSKPKSVKVKSQPSEENTT